VATVFGEGCFLFLHDGPVHKARSIQKWFVVIGVEELDWTAYVKYVLFSEFL
jgi:hypothetical protein